jgi:hypothetical protein
MIFTVPNKNTTHVCLDGVYYPVLDGVVEVPAGRLPQELERLGYEPVTEGTPPPGLVFDNAPGAEGAAAAVPAPAPGAAKRKK